MAFRQSFAADDLAGGPSDSPPLALMRILGSRALYFTTITSGLYSRMCRSAFRILRDRGEHQQFASASGDRWPPRRDYVWVKVGYNLRMNGVDCDYALYFFKEAADLRACILDFQACLVLES